MSLVALLAGFVVRFLIPGFFTESGILPLASFVVGISLVLGAPVPLLLWWRTAFGYVSAIVLGILTIIFQTVAAGPLVEWTVNSYIVIIPQYILAVLVIVGSVLAWREG